MVWGSSCQNFSLAGNRKGLDGDASKYFIDGLKRQKEIMPKTFIFENVNGMLSANNGNDFKYALQAFRDMGYLISYKVLNAKDYGTAQNRERVFIVGFLNKDDYHSFSFEDKKPLKKCLNDYLEANVDEKYFLSKKMIKNLESKSIFNFEPHTTKTKVCKCLTARYYKTGRTDPYLKQVGSIGNSQADRVYATDGISCTLKANGGGGGAKTGLYTIPSATSKGYEVATENDSINFTHPNSKTRRGRVGKGVAQTLDCSCNQGIIREEKIRRLTPRECFRLMGVKDEDIKLINSDTQSYKIAGNGIEVNTIRSIVRALYKNDKQNNLFDFMEVV